MSHEPHSLEEVVAGIEDLTHSKDRVSLGDALEEFGSLSFGPLLVLLPLVEFSPLGGIPGVPTALAVVAGLIAIQILLGRDHIWIPEFIQNRTMNAERLGNFAAKLEGFARKIDHVFHGRFKWLTEGWPVRLAAVPIVGLCALVPPLEVLPFASSAPMLAIAAFGLALLVRDGLLMLVATAMACGALVVAVSTIGSSTGL